MHLQPRREPHVAALMRPPAPRWGPTHASFMHLTKKDDLLLPSPGSVFVPVCLIVRRFCMKEFPDVRLDLINFWRRSRVGGVIILFGFFRHSELIFSCVFLFKVSCWVVV